MRRTFAPVVLVGLAATGLTAVAGHKTMLRVSSDGLEKLGLGPLTDGRYADLNSAEFPLAGALALVALAAWGVVLVARGRVRRLVAALATLAATGVLAVVVFGGFVEDQEFATDFASTIGATSMVGDLIEVERTGWFWAALLGSVVAVAAGVAAYLFAPSWPEMGSRYDAPSAAPTADAGDSTPAENRSSIDLWKQLDEGDDPTA